VEKARKAPLKENRIRAHFSEPGRCALIRFRLCLIAVPLIWDIWDIEKNPKFSITPYIHLHGNKIAETQLLSDRQTLLLYDYSENCRVVGYKSCA
jgi:hypothetical protein